MIQLKKGNNGTVINAKTNEVVEKVSESVLFGLDYILLLDISPSMNNASHRFKGLSRLEEVEKDVFRVAATADKYDNDGLTVISFDSQVYVEDGVHASAVKKLFNRTLKGSTNLAGALEAAFKKAKASNKQTVIICYTDGVPDNKEAVTRAINQAGRDLGRPKVGLTIIQVGQNAEAAAYLKGLDDTLAVDITAVLSAESAAITEVEHLIHLARTA